MAYYTQEEYFNMIMAYSAADQDPSAAVRVYRQRHPDAGRFPSADTIARFRNLWAKMIILLEEYFVSPSGPISMLIGIFFGTFFGLMNVSLRLMGCSIQKIL